MKRFVVKVNINGSSTDVFDTKQGVFVTRYATAKNARAIAAKYNKDAK